ncbi:ATP-binding protein [Curtobacterium flaccumfaciens pv. flaccumfaciens]|nr:ATP-binding protein [Curtobacterium flaccumfaciens pv. flaccumfaciens]
MSQECRTLVDVEHFDVVEALARTALGGGRAAVTRQIERLESALAADGRANEARSLRGILDRASRVQAVEPLDLVPSAATATRALPRLSTKSSLPVDRESSAPLCEVVFPDAGPVQPVLQQRAESAFEGLVREWTHEEALHAAGLSVSRSLLLYGPPGTGKTTLALNLASRMGRPAVIARLDGLISSFLGNTARNLGALFDFCNRYDTVLVLDEFDAVAKIRDDPNEVGEIKRVVNALLQNLDKRADVGLTIAITNHDQLLDAAIWRRFEHQIRLGLPDAELRRQIADVYLTHLGSPPSLAKAVVWATEGRSGADVRSLVLTLTKVWVMSGMTMSQAGLLRAASHNGAHLRDDADRALNGSDADLAKELADSAGMTGSEIGQLFDRDRRTVARWMQG